MGRPRTIDQNAILDAAEIVVVRLGAAHLTLDAVATEAGVSKASVIYDYKTKQQLIKAVLERGLAREEDGIRQAVAEVAGSPDSTMKGLIAVAVDMPPDDMRAVVINLTAALARDAELHKIVGDFFERTISSLAETSTNIRNTRLAFLALEGMKTLEWHNFYSWPKEERAQILRDIAWLISAPLPPADGS